MSIQLRSIITLLNEHPVPYWIDFGTLLGLMREGKPLEHDRDIDICIWAKDEDRLRTIIPSMKKMGYRMKIRSYYGMDFNYKFFPEKHSGLRKLDINMFRRAGEFAWCPQPHPIPNTYKGLRFQLFRIVRGILWWVLKIPYPFISRVSLTAWPFCRFINVDTWWVPAHYFENLVRLKEWKCYIPKEWEKYLTSKYGDWKTPVKEWNFWIQDRVLVQKDPFVLIKETEHQQNAG